MSKIVTGYIGPITADAVSRQIGISLKKAEERERTSLAVPLPPMLDVFVPKILSHDPFRVDDATIEHARKSAHKIIADLATIPHTPGAGDLLSLAFTVLHYTGDKPHGR